MKGGDKGKKTDDGGKRPNTRAYALTQEQARQDPDVVSGMFLVNGFIASILFDSGANRSFIYASFAKLTGLREVRAPETFSVETASDRSVKVSSMIKECKIDLDGCTFTATLYIISLGGFDVVLGWIG